MVPRWFRDDSIGFRRYNVSKSLGTFPENDPEHRHVAQVGLTASGATFCCNLIFQNVYQKTRRELSCYYYCSRLCNKSDIGVISLINLFFGGKIELLKPSDGPGRRVYALGHCQGAFPAN